MSMEDGMGSEKERPSCEDCAWRANYIDNPRSFKGMLWKLHTYICPGWKSYQKQLAREQAEQQTSN